jgi:hypothetical protein
MGRTLKDSSSSRTTPGVYEVIKRQDSLFDILHNGEITQRSISERWLEAELAKHGICGSELRDVCRQLNEGGKAKLSF